MEKTRRLFVALPLPRPVAALVTDAVERSGVAPAEFRTYAPEDLHLTLRFLGALAEPWIPELERHLGSRVRGLDVPELELCATGAFPSASRPRVLWVGVRETDRARGALSACVAAAEAAALDAGFSPDARASAEAFAAHVTVARPRPRRHVTIPDAFLHCAPSARWTADAIVLFESRPQRAAGERYVARATYDLGRGPSG